MAGWAEIDKDVLDLIAKRLYLADYQSLGAVCSRWRCFIKARRHQKFPWLVLSNVDNDRNPPDMHPFFKLFDSNITNLKVPEIRWKRCCGSSHGWLITASENPVSFHLLNPFSRFQIPLPPPSAFPCEDPHHSKEFYFIHKAVLSSDPASSSSPAGFTVMAIYSWDRRLAFFRSGDERWTHVESSDSYFQDIMYYKGQFYAQCYTGSILVCDLGNHPRTTEVAPPTWSLAKSPPNWWTGDHRKSYVAADSSGDLLYVCRMIKFIRDDGGSGGNEGTNNEDDDDSHGSARHSGHRYRTCYVKVFRFDKSLRGWLEVTSLGHNTLLFLGQNSFVSLSVEDFPSFQGNRIYFTDDYFDGYSQCPDGCIDFVAWSLEDERAEPFLPTGLEHALTSSVTSPPIWIIPNPW